MSTSSMEAAAQQLLRSLRGARSQKALARRLGYRANPVTDWEHGRRYPTAIETLRVAEQVGVDVSSAFANFWPAIPLRTTSGPHPLCGWMRGLLGGVKIGEAARRMGRSRPTVSRWLSGTGQPRLPEFLEFVDAVTGRVPDLVAELVPIEQVPALAARYGTAQAARRVAFEKPWTEAILRVLETESYRRLSVHDSSIVARVLAIATAEVDECLDLLGQAEVVRRVGDKFEELRQLNVDTRGGRAALQGTKRHWVDVAAARTLEPDERDWFAYNVCSASRADIERIREVLRLAFREIRGIVAASEPQDDVALINLQLVVWDGAGGSNAPKTSKAAPGFPRLSSTAWR